MKPRIRKPTPGRLLAARRFQAPLASAPSQPTDDDAGAVKAKLRDAPAKASNIRFKAFVEKIDTEG